MKAYIRILLACFFAKTINAQTVTSSCDLNDVNGYLYKDDADRLAIRHSYKFNSTWKDSTWIDQQLSNRYLKALLAVHNATGLPASDTVTTWLNIHTNVNRPQLREFFIAADSNLIWMKNLRYNVVPCGQPFVDAAINKYGFQKTAFHAIPFIPWHTVYWDASYNFNGNPLASAIGSTVAGIQMIGGDNGFGDGIDIADTINSNYVELLYCYRWGDCIAGCMYAHYWRFRVYNDCSVGYFGSTGNQLPVWASLIEKSAALQNIKIAPNPVNEKLNLEIPDAFTGSVQIQIVNVLGQLVKKQQLEKGNLNIDVSELKSGTYFLNLQAIDGIKTFKFVKL